MPQGDSPTLARRRVRLAIREAREKANLTQAQVAEEMDWSLSKVIRIENGEVSVSVNDLKPLLSFVGIKDKALVASLIGDTKIARQRQLQRWYHQQALREYMSDSYQRLAEYETVATAIRSYCIYYPPGPLQTPEYASALTGSWDDVMDTGRAQAMIDARTQRRKAVHERLGDLQYYLVVDQSVLERSIGGAAVLRGQLEQLEELAAGRLIHIRMLPFDLDTPIANNGSFDLLSIDNGEVMYRENGLTDEIVEGSAVTERHRERFEQLWQVALTEDDTIAFIKKKIASLEAKLTERSSHVQQ